MCDHHHLKKSNDNKIIKSFMEQEQPCSYTTSGTRRNTIKREEIICAICVKVSIILLKSMFRHPVYVRSETHSIYI